MTASPARPALRRHSILSACALLLLPSLLLAGKGALPGITPSPFAFGAVPVGASSPAQVFTLDNPSAETLTITSAGLGGAAPGQFTVDGNGCAGVVLTPGSTCALAVRFTPTAAGNQVALVRVLYTSAGSPGGVETTSAIAGTGLPPAAPARPAPAVGTLALALGVLLMVLGAWVGRRAG
jgi:hypothetical protein